MAAVYLAKDFLALGFELRGYHTWEGHSASSQEESFRSVYGTNSKVLEVIWRDLQRTPFVDCRIDTAITKPIHLLLTYRWMKSYESEAELHTSFNLSEKTISKHIQIAVGKVALLRKIKVSRRTYLSRFCLQLSLTLHISDRSKLGR
jgi:hypothetical protein